MVTKFEKQALGETSTTNTAAAAAATAKAEKPSEVPDKFWNVEKGVVDYAAWSKSTQEAERKLTELSTAQKAAADAEAKEAERVKTEAEAKVKAHNDSKALIEKKLSDLKAAGGSAEDQKKVQDELDAHVKAAPKAPETKQTPNPAVTPKLAEDFRKSYADNGNKVTQEFYDKFAAVGIDKNMLDGYVAGQHAIASQRDTDILSKAGVKDADEFKAIGEWAKANTTDAERQAVNEALQNGTPEAAALALSSIKAKYTAAVGSNPNLLGGGLGNRTAAGFTSLAEQKAAQKDKRYEKDSAYRAEVERKIELSTGY